MGWFARILGSLRGEPRTAPPFVPSTLARTVDESTPSSTPNRLSQPPKVAHPPDSAVPSQSSRSPSAAPAAPIKWLGAGKPVKLAHVGVIPSPMTYFCDGRKGTAPGDVIDISKPVSPGDTTDPVIDVSYASMTPVRRFHYLRWLASGRRSAPDDLAYAKLFLCGLERRSLVDRRDVTEVFDEVLLLVSRLRDKNDAPGTKLAERILSLVWFLVARESASIDHARLRALVTATGAWVPERIALLLVWFQVWGAGLPAWAAARIAVALSTAQTKKPPDTEWVHRYERVYPDGFKLQEDAIPQVFEYEAVSESVGRVSTSRPSPLLRREQFNELLKLFAPNNEPSVAPTRSVLPPRTASPTPPPVPVRPVESKPPPLPVPTAHSGQGATAPRPSGLRWCGPDDTLNLSGLGIAHRPMTYAFIRAGGLTNPEPAAIDGSLSVSDQPYRPAPERELDYWPSYAHLNPCQRRYYLDWLVRGRREAPAELGYTFLYFYGLERRALVERADTPAIFDEVLRLKSLYVDSVSRSFESYTDTFLWFLSLREARLIGLDRIRTLCNACRSWSEDNLATMLGWWARTREVLPAWCALRVARELPISVQGVVVRRVRSELDDLFYKRFQETYPAGFELKLSKRDRRYAYRPASAALSPFEEIGPNPWGVPSQFGALADLWNGCVSDLKRLSSLRRSGGPGELTVAAWEAMPVELKADIDHPCSEALSRLAGQQLDDRGHFRTNVKDLASTLKIDFGDRLTAAEAKRIAQTASDAGYAVEPDVRLTGRTYRPDDTLCLFREDSDSPVDPARWSLASLMLTAGVALAGIDGHVGEDEVAVLTQQIEVALELNTSERRRLEVLRAALIDQGADVSEVTKLFKRLDPARRDLMAQLILTMVAADGVVSSDELRAVRKLYISLGFSRTESEQAIAVLTKASAPDDSPVAVAPAVDGVQGETIPPPPQEKRDGLRLNREAIASIMKETRDVAYLLAQAMNLETAPDTTPPKLATDPPVAESVSTAETDTGIIVDPSIPSRYAAFYQVVVSRTTWTRTELMDLAKRHNLMLSGAVDAINDWSTEQYGGPLLYEDGEQYSLESAYLN